MNPLKSYLGNVKRSKAHSGTALFHKLQFRLQELQGKVIFSAGIATAAYLPGGPLVQPRGEVICVGSSFTQSRIIFDACLAFSKPFIDAEPDRF